MTTMNGSARRLHGDMASAGIGGENSQHDQETLVADGGLLLNPEEEANRALASFAEVERRAADLHEMMDGLRWQRDMAVIARNEVRLRLENATSACESLDCFWGIDLFASEHHAGPASSLAGLHALDEGNIPGQRDAALWDHRRLRLADATLARWEADMLEQRIGRLGSRLTEAQAEMDSIRAEMNEKRILVQGMQRGYPDALRRFGSS